MRLQVNIICFEIPIYTTHALKCVRLQVDITGSDMPMYITHTLQISIYSWYNKFWDAYVCNLRYFPAWEGKRKSRIFLLPGNIEYQTVI